MRHVLDTGVFFRPEALRRLADDDEDIVVPAVAAAERMRQLARDGQDVDALDRLLGRMEADVEPFGRLEALRVVARVAQLPETEWARLARDALVAGHVRPDDMLWTTNPRDFLALGLREDQIVPV